MLDLEFEKLTERWEKLSPRAKAVILVTAGIRDAHPAGHAPTKFKRAAKGESADWLPTALNLLRDGGERISNREIARRLGISHSALTRNETFRRARAEFVDGH